MKRPHLCRCLCSIVLFGFLLGIQDGRIALWKDGEKEPWRVFPYPVAALPAETQQALRNGIPIDSTEDLDRLLENLLS